MGFVPSLKIREYIDSMSCNYTNIKTIILFTRIPVAGKTKTRLSPFLTLDECVNLHYSFMADELEAISSIADRVDVCYFEDEEATDDDKDEFRSFLNDEISIPFCTFPQRGTDIFDRMKNAFSDSWAFGAPGRKVLVGCDVPCIDADLISCAFRSLLESDVVIGPTDDGGYCYVGLNELKSCVFHVKDEGQKTVLDDTLKQCGKETLNVALGKEEKDVDVPADFYELWKKREFLSSNSLTKVFLDNFDTSRFELAGLCGSVVSVIVPIYNEISTISTFLERVGPIAEKAEIIFADGGSSDGTVGYLQENLPINARLIRTEKGRAKQMNEAARLAKGDILMFLHCDCRPPKSLVEQVRKTLKKANWGCFGVKFDDSDPLMKICQIISNNRIYDRKVVFGDQGIFIKKDLFFEIGSFPDLPIMEDYQLSLTLKQRGEKIGVAKGLIETSSRRYHEGGKLKVMWQMNRLRKAYRDGVPIEEIAAAYRDIR